MDFFDSNEFVILNDILTDAFYDIRYYSDYNFIGKRIPGYLEEIAIVSRAAAIRLKMINQELKKYNLCLKIFDAYRPTMAVQAFLEWSKDLDDIKMKDVFYPNLDKSKLIPRGYISKKSSHSRGSTVDLTICNRDTGKELDMGGYFDLFSDSSHISYHNLSCDAKNNRLFLQNIMKKYGFLPIEEEWWHFTLDEEPFPDSYFNIFISRSSFKK